MILHRLRRAALLGVGLGLAALLPACSLFESQTTRNEKRYEKYVGKSRQAKVRRQKSATKQEAAIPAAAVPPPQVDAQAGEAPGPAPGQPDGTAPPQQFPPPGAEPAPTP